MDTSCITWTSWYLFVAIGVAFEGERRNCWPTFMRMVFRWVDSTIMWWLYYMECLVMCCYWWEFVLSLQRSASKCHYLSTFWMFSWSTVMCLPLLCWVYCSMYECYLFWHEHSSRSLYRIHIHIYCGHWIPLQTLDIGNCALIQNVKSWNKATLYGFSYSKYALYIGRSARLCLDDNTMPIKFIRVQNSVLH